MNKRYRLLRDLPGVYKGAIYIQENEDPEYYNTNGKSYYDRIHKGLIEYSDWFQPIEAVVEAVSGSKIEDDKYWLFNCSDGMTYQTTPERLFQLISKDDKSGWQQKPKAGFPNRTSEKKRIEIINVGQHNHCTTLSVYQFTASEKISADKYPAIKAAIEEVLNEEPKLGWVYTDGAKSTLGVDWIYEVMLKGIPNGSLLEVVQWLKNIVVKTKRFELAAGIREIEKIIQAQQNKTPL